MAAQTQSLAAPPLARIEPSLGRRLTSWLVMLLLLITIVYNVVVLLIFTPNPGQAASMGCTDRYLPTQSCYWLKGLPAPGITDDRSLFLALDTSRAAAGLGFGVLMLGLLIGGGVGLATGARWRGWVVGAALIMTVVGWKWWSAIPVNFDALGQVLAILFLASMVILSAFGLYGLAVDKPWVRTLLVLGGAYAVLFGALWVTEPVVLFEVLVGVLLILLLLERQGRRRPSLNYRVSSWTVIPLMVALALVATHAIFIASAHGIAASTLNWQTIFQRTLEHLKVVLMASLMAIATAVPLGILITRDHKFALNVRRVLMTTPRVLLIVAGYAAPALLAWWVEDPALASERGLIRALIAPVVAGLLIGGAIHWLIRRQVRKNREWGAVDSWQSLAPVAINIANVGQTVPSIAVLGLSMSFLGIGFLPAILALWIRALLPILHNTVAGILAVEPDILEAARGMGMTRRQVLVRIELPLAMAIIFAGIRTSVVFNIGVGALAFYIGAGGLGHLIAIGIALSNDDILITGGILTALMAITADFVMGHIEERLAPPTV